MHVKISFKQTRYQRPQGSHKSGGKKSDHPVERRGDEGPLYTDIYGGKGSHDELSRSTDVKQPGFKSKTDGKTRKDQGCGKVHYLPHPFCTCGETSLQDDDKAVGCLRGVTYQENNKPEEQTGKNSNDGRSGIVKSTNI